MKITNEKLIEILKENWYISDVLQYPALEVTFNVIEEQDEDIFVVQMLVTNGDNISDIHFKVNTKGYDEKFSDVDEYEVDDMGVGIEIYEPEHDFEFDLETIWKLLFFNKERKF